jgi:hypothetical protein
MAANQWGILPPSWYPSGWFWPLGGGEPPVELVANSLTIGSATLGQAELGPYILEAMDLVVLAPDLATPVFIPPVDLEAISLDVLQPALGSPLFTPPLDLLALGVALGQAELERPRGVWPLELVALGITIDTELGTPRRAGSPNMADGGGGGKWKRQKGGLSKIPRKRFGAKAWT